MWVYGWGELPGQLVVISGPSGSGKSSIIRELLARDDVRARLSVSATTRPPRLGERPGIDYDFMTLEQFQSGVERQEFLEFAEYNHHYYGTPAEPVRQALARGECVLLEIEAQGAMQVRRKAPAALFVFVDVPSFRDLASRLMQRATESEQQIHNRLVIARDERDQAHRYDYRLINDNLQSAVDELAMLIKPLQSEEGN
jgi:guanylate kinase